MEKFLEPESVTVIGDSASFPALRKHLEAMGAPVFTEVSRGAMVLGRAFNPQILLAS